LPTSLGRPPGILGLQSGEDVKEDVQKIATDVCFMANGSLILKEEISSVQDNYLELQGLDGCEERFRPMVVRRFRNRAIVRRDPELSELLLTNPTVVSRELSLDDLLIALIERGASHDSVDL
jgi:hypothetical protein